MNNHLTSAIPETLRNLTGLSILNLSLTQLGGVILVKLNLSYNQFSGDTPTTIGNLSGLSFLDLQGNPFTGEIADEIGSLSQLD
uniref:Uncharacterized protein n=1 Tax=Physcomitrium patens TaxID=3218 RepID=A0A2K1L8U8_PHYPA|nr:hypothetical protein PHYPA_000889 [Physcomitrium patens]